MDGFSWMTGYATLIKKFGRCIREIKPSSHIVWGGNHPIIVPENAILHADAICAGKGEFACQNFYQNLSAGRAYYKTCNFWFSNSGEVIRVGFLPLMTAAQMDGLPTLHYGHDELI